jgi:hypothetical protein
MISARHGWAWRVKNGGHENSELPNSSVFFLDEQAVIDQAYNSIDVTTRIAKFLINAFTASGRTIHTTLAAQRAAGKAWSSRRSSPTITMVSLQAIRSTMTRLFI